MEDFAENACPTQQCIVGSLGILRKRPAPFSADALASRLDLLFLPFLRGIPTADQRIRRLKEALKLAAGRLARDHEIAYRHVFLEPAHQKLDERRQVALPELQELAPLKERESPATVSRMEERMLPVLADILLDLEFEQELDSEHPKPKHIESIGPTHAFQTLSFSASADINNDDHRKVVVHRLIRLETLLPDQRVAPIRYHHRASDPMPVKGSVKTLSDGHTYLGTLPDSQDGAVADWMIHFVALGGRKNPGDVSEIEMVAEYFDKDRNETHPYITLTADHVGVRSADLSMRLPLDKLSEATAEYRIVSNPHSNGVIIGREPLDIAEDGWVRAEFTNLLLGHLYGIFCPNVNLYK